MQSMFIECELFGFCVCVCVCVRARVRVRACVRVHMHDLQLLQHLSLFAPV
jgi:hypothetical protein